MSTPSLIDKETVAVKRQTNFGQFGSDGFPNDPVFENMTSRGMAAPLSGLQILQVPEADRSRQLLNWFTAAKLELKDLVTRNGVDFEVQNVEDWTMSGICLSFYKCTLVRVDVER